MQGGDKSIGQKSRSAVRWTLLALHLCVAIHLIVSVHPIAGVVLAASAVTHLPLKSRFLRRLVFVLVLIVSILPLLACSMSIWWLLEQEFDRDNLPTIILVITVTIANFFVPLLQKVPGTNRPDASIRP